MGHLILPSGVQRFTVMTVIDKKTRQPIRIKSYRFNPAIHEPVERTDTTFNKVKEGEAVLKASVEAEAKKQEHLKELMGKDPEEEVPEEKPKRGRKKQE